MPRITELTRVSAYESDDFIPIDSPTAGTRRIAVSNIAGDTPTSVDVFDGASTITPSYSVGIAVSTSSVSDSIGAISGSEWSDDYEGFNIALKNLVIGKEYVLSFDFQFSNTVFFEGMYVVGYLLSSTDRTDYYNFTEWTDNLSRDLLSHTHAIIFTATNTTMYLCFNLCGCSDGQTNYWAITNLQCLTTQSGGSIDYSTSEQDTGLKWIDGSAVYQKTYQYNSVISVNSYVTLDTSIKQSDIVFLETVQLSMRIDSGIGTNLYSNTIAGVNAEVATNDTGLYLENKTLYDIHSFTLTVRYAKVSS